MVSNKYDFSTFNGTGFGSTSADPQEDLEMDIAGEGQRFSQDEKVLLTSNTNTVKTKQQKLKGYNKQYKTNLNKIDY